MALAGVWQEGPWCTHWEGFTTGPKVGGEGRHGRHGQGQGGGGDGRAGPGWSPPSARLEVRWWDGNAVSSVTTNSLACMPPRQHLLETQG